MAYQYVPDTERTEEYPVQEDLAKMLDDLPTAVSIDNIKYFDPFEQDLIVAAVEELADVVEASNGSHSAAYYRGVVLSELYGFEDMDEQAQEAAARIALGLYRKAHPEMDPKRGNRSVTEAEVLAGTLEPGEGNNPMNSHTGTPYKRYLVIDGKVVASSEGDGPAGAADDFDPHIAEGLKDPFGRNFTIEGESWMPSAGFWYPCAQPDACTPTASGEDGLHVIAIANGAEAYKMADYAEGLLDEAYAAYLMGVYRECVRYAVEREENIYAREVDILRARMGQDLAEDISSGYAADPMGMVNQMLGGALTSSMGDTREGSDVEEDGLPPIASKLEISVTDGNGVTFHSELSRGPGGWEVEMREHNGNWLASAGSDSGNDEYDFDFAYENLSESSYEGYDGSLDIDDVQEAIRALGYSLDKYQSLIDKGDPFDFKMSGFASAKLEYANEYGVFIDLQWNGGAPAHCDGCEPRPTGSSDEVAEGGGENENISPRPTATVERLMAWAKDALGESDYDAFQQLPYIELSEMVEKWNDEDVSDEELIGESATLDVVVAEARSASDGDGDGVPDAASKQPNATGAKTASNCEVPMDDILASMPEIGWDDFTKDFANTSDGIALVKLMSKIECSVNDALAGGYVVEESGEFLFDVAFWQAHPELFGTYVFDDETYDLQAKFFTAAIARECACRGCTLASSGDKTEGIEMLEKLEDVFFGSGVFGEDVDEGWTPPEMPLFGGDGDEDDVPVASVPDAGAPTRRKLTVIGCENRSICFVTVEEDGKLTFSAQTFGIGEEIELFSTDVPALSDDGMNEIPFSEASFEWGALPNMASAFPAWEEDETSFYNEAENAYCHALKEMYGFENLMSCDIYKVCGYENMDSIKKDEEYEAIFSLLRVAYNIDLDEEQKEKFKAGETFQAWTPFGTVEIDSAKVMSEFEKNKQANETDQPILPNDAFQDPSAGEEAETFVPSRPIEAYAKVEWVADPTGSGWMPDEYNLAVTEKGFFDREQRWDDGQTDEYYEIQQMLPSYVGELQESVYEIDPAICPKTMSIADVQAKISADSHPDLTLIWNDATFDSL